jgi:poly(hydroxyalkanoate) granule-associated protein
MATKQPGDSSANPDGSASASPSVKDSAQQIWLAGLGAFAKAQEEGGKVFEALVKEGLGMQRKSQTIAEEKLTEATHKMSNLAQGMTERATGQWDKLENIFEDRVAKALKKLGVPSARDVELLLERVDALTLAVQELSARTEGGKPAAKRPAARKTAVDDSAAE